MKRNTKTLVVIFLTLIVVACRFSEFSHAHMASFPKNGVFYQEYAIGIRNGAEDTLYTFYMSFDSARITRLTYDSTGLAIFVARKTRDSNAIVTDKLKFSLFVVAGQKVRPERPAGYDSIDFNSSRSESDGRYATMSGEYVSLYTHDRKIIVNSLNDESRREILLRLIKESSRARDIILVSVLSSNDSVHVSVTR